MQYINKMLWSISFVMIIISGIYFSIKLKGQQFNIIKQLKSLKSNSKDKISSFDTLMMSTAAKVGVGSLAGVALAIYKGGIGTIFWIWLTSIISAPNAFAEGLLGRLYKRRIGKDNIGGPAQYITTGLNNKNLGIIYAVIVTIVYVICFSTIQANTIATSLNINRLLIGILLFIVVYLIINNNTQVLFKIISKLVPLMAISYILLGMFVFIKNYNQIPIFFLNILKDALNLKSGSIGITTCIIIGIQRGIFSSEAGIGTGAIAAASANDELSTPLIQGRTQILGVYFISLIIGTITAFIIISSPYKSINLVDINGIELTAFAFNYHFGKIGHLFLVMIIIIFALSTIIAGFFYGKSNLEFIFNKLTNNQEKLYKIFISIIMILGSTLSSNIIWNLSDIFIALLALINIYAILSLRKDIVNNIKK